MAQSKPVIKRKWDFGFEADAAQEPNLKQLVAKITPENLPRQRRATPRFSDLMRAGMEAGTIPKPHARLTDD